MDRLRSKAFAEARIIIKNKILEARGDELDSDQLERLMERKKDLIQELAERRLEKKKDALNVDFKDKFSPKTAKKKTPVNYLAKFSEEVENDSPIFKSILRKTNETGIDLDILGEVYNRGYNSWDKTKNVSPEQYAFARLNSYINQGKTYFEEDKDLHEGYKIRSKGFENVEVVHKGRVIHRCKDPHSARMFIANHNKEVKESALEESKSTPYVKPFHAIDNPEVQVGWKASNKHGKVKWFGKDFKSAAHKHAGIAEEIEINEGQFTKVMVSRSSMGAGARFASSHTDDHKAKKKYGLTDNWNKVRGLPKGHPPTYYKDGKYYHFLKEDLNESITPTRTFHVGVIMNRKSPDTKERESKTLRFTFEHPDTPAHTQPDGKYGHDWHPSNVQQMLDSNKSYSKHSKDGWSHGDNSMHYSTKKEKVDEFLAAKTKDPHKYITMREDLEESWGVKTRSFKDFKDGAQDWANNHTHDGKVEFHTKEVGVGDKKWHQTIASSPHHDYRIGHFNHSGKGKSEEGSGQHLHWSDSGMDESVDLDESIETNWKVNPKNSNWSPISKVLANDKESFKKLGYYHAKNKKPRAAMDSDWGQYHYDSGYNSLKEESEELHELSKKSLKSYLHKADRKIDSLNSKLYSGRFNGLDPKLLKKRDLVDKSQKLAARKYRDKMMDEDLEEGKMKDLAHDLEHMANGNFKQKYGKTKQKLGNAVNDPAQREDGSSSVVRAYKADTPGESLDEAVKRADKVPVLIPTHTDEYGNTIPAKTVMRKSGRQIIKSGDLTNGRPG